MNQLTVSLQHSIATLAANGWSARKIARELGVHRETVGRYLRPPEPVAKPAIVPTGSPEVSDSKPAIVPAGSKAGRTSQCAPLAEVIQQSLLAGLSAQRIYQDLVAGHGFTGAYDAVKRFVRRLARKVEPPFRRMECAPGAELQVDFGQGAWVVVEKGKRRRPHLFRAVLSHSRKGYSEVVCVVDGSVLGLIKQWLKAPVVEPSPDGQPPTVRRNEQGTPQGGVLSPLLANIYLHWFDHLFQRADGPAHWAKAKLIRYADDFVVLARYVSPQLRGWIEGKLEGWLGLQINREKTRVLDLRETGQSLDFLGYTFRYDRDQYGRETRRSLNLHPSGKAMAREREALRQLINPHQSHTPLPEWIGRVNRHLRGWSNYFQLGYPRPAFRHLNHFVRLRLGKHLQRRSQRGWRARQGVSLYAHLQHLGLVAL